jgi:hypothetical protein
MPRELVEIWASLDVEENAFYISDRRLAFRGITDTALTLHELGRAVAQLFATDDVDVKLRLR